jgi:hypothetical protein
VVRTRAVETQTRAAAAAAAAAAVNAERRAELAARSARLSHRTRHWQLPTPALVPALLPEEVAQLEQHKERELSARCAPPLFTARRVYLSTTHTLPAGCSFSP